MHMRRILMFLTLRSPGSIAQRRIDTEISQLKVFAWVIGREEVLLHRLIQAPSTFHLQDWAPWTFNVLEPLGSYLPWYVPIFPALASRAQLSYDSSALSMVVSTRLNIPINPEGFPARSVEVLKEILICYCSSIPELLKADTRGVEILSRSYCADSIFEKKRSYSLAPLDVIASDAWDNEEQDFHSGALGIQGYIALWLDKPDVESSPAPLKRGGHGVLSDSDEVYMGGCDETALPYTALASCNVDSISTPKSGDELDAPEG
ncbi:hypothetical protein BDN72DRAFT_859082 [Pluteus cervinus]|uniref:Uncharacterized protein n=1 Tax=Pluteus cervinus TaxID=181527 RepID=A0ACD3AQB2_9AGAR|nr:hypothetical protein BDN72DRAFT_859082 [Pluteus cervinus]